MKSDENILKNARAMAKAASGGIGPDVVIIVNSSDEQALFWQKRLTSRDEIHSQGEVVKKDALILSVSESNWRGGAGNGLGTLNGFIQAARKACELEIIECPENPSIEELKDAFLAYCKGKSIFMVHTAGKGTRIAPLPGSECNSKSNIKLPGIVTVGGVKEPMTILEAVLIVTNIYAPTRNGRLSVFWGDQIIINENSIDFNSPHHVEIFGELMSLTEDIKSYGVLIPSGEGDARVREKFLKEEILELLPEGLDKVYRSVGSFTISLPLLGEFIKLEEDALASESGSLNTDPDWWQPLTSSKDEYVNIMAKKGIEPQEAARRWDAVTVMWDCFTKKNPGRKIGFTDIGANSLWWDYGQNAYYLRNIQLLTENSTEGEAARIFFGVEGERVKDSRVEASYDNCIILESGIKRGTLKNCVIVNSYLEEVYAEDAVIIGSTVLKLNATGALCYNVVEEEARLTEGEVLVNIFHPEKGRIPMKTHVSRDGRSDWEAGVKVGKNAYTYPEIARMMKDVKPRRVKVAKQEEEKKLKR